MESIPAISIVNLAKRYTRGAERVHALRGVSFEIQSGEFIAITGPSGSGKSTLLHLVGALDRPSSGSVRIHGEEIGDKPERELRGLRGGRIGFVYQQFYLLPGLTVEENILLPLLFSRAKCDGGRISEILGSVGLAHRRSHLPSQLSGGEMQRVAIGRALAGKPEIILADEPTANLDSENGLAIFELLRGLARRGITVVIVTHNAELAARTDRIIRLRDGLLV
jgi:ABC-type lipoprotein export system ATPase subunit